MHETYLYAALTLLLTLLLLLISRRRRLKSLEKKPADLSPPAIEPGDRAYDVRVEKATRNDARPMKPCTEEELKATIDKWRRHFSVGNWR
jgi:hypothetical protein